MSGRNSKTRTRAWQALLPLPPSSVFPPGTGAVVETAGVPSVTNGPAGEVLTAQAVGAPIFATPVVGPPITTAANFAQPVSDGVTTVNIQVTSSTNARVNAWAEIIGGGWYLITAVPDGTHITVRNQGLSTSAPAGTVIAAGAAVYISGAQFDPDWFDIRNFGATTADIGPAVHAALLAVQLAKGGTIYIPPRLDGTMWNWATPAVINWTTDGTGVVPGYVEIVGFGTQIRIATPPAGFPTLTITDSTGNVNVAIRDLTLTGNPAAGDDCARAMLITSGIVTLDRVFGLGIQGRDGFGIFDLTAAQLIRVTESLFAGCNRPTEGGVLAVTGGGMLLEGTVFSVGVVAGGVTYNKGGPQSYVYNRGGTAPCLFDDCIFSDNAFGVAQVWYKAPANNPVSTLTFRSCQITVSLALGNTGPAAVLIEGHTSAPPSQPLEAGVEFDGCQFSDNGGHREIQQPQPIVQSTDCGQIRCVNCETFSGLELNPANTDPNLFPAKGFIPLSGNGPIYLEKCTGLRLRPYFKNQGPPLYIDESGGIFTYPPPASVAGYDAAEQIIFHTGATYTGALATYNPVAPTHKLQLEFTPPGAWTVTFTGAENNQASFLATLVAQLAPFATALNNGGQTELELIGSLQMYGASSGQVLASSDADVLTSLGLSAIAFPTLPTVSQIGDQSGNGHLLQGIVPDAASLKNPDPNFNNQAALHFRTVDELKNFGAFAALPQPFGIYLVAKQAVTGAGNVYAFDGSVADQCSIVGNSAGTTLSLNAGAGATWNVNTTQLHAYFFVVDGANSILYVDGVAQTAQNAGANALAGITLGQKGGGGALAGWDIGDLDVYANPTIELIQSVTAYAQHHYGTPQRSADPNFPGQQTTLWLGIDSISQTADNWSLRSDGRNLFVQTPILSGDLVFQFGNITIAGAFINAGGSTSLNLFGLANDFGAGVHIVKLTNAPGGGDPIGNPNTGSLLWSSSTGYFSVRSENGAICVVNPVGDGVQASQAGTHGTQKLFYLQTTVSGAPTTADIPIATNENKNFRLVISGRIAAGSATGTVGDAWGATREAMFKNVGGVVSQVGAMTIVSTFTDANMATASAALSVSGTNVRVTITAPVGEGANPTIDWEVLVIALDD